MAQIGALNIFVPNTVIQSAPMNANFNTIKTTYNAHDIATTGVHGMGASTIVGTDLVQTLTNKTLIDPIINGATFTDNLDIWNGFDLRAYSDAGVTQTADIDGALGDAWFLGKVGIGGNVLVVDFSVSRTTIGGYVDIVFSNADNTNPASHTRLNISSAGAGGGNPSIQWSIPGFADYSMGIVNTAGDRFTFSESSVLDTNNRMVFDGANQRWGFFTDAPTVEYHISKALAGSTFRGALQNSDNTNVASHAYFAVTTGGAASGDPMFLLSVDGVTTDYIGLDNSDNDYLKIGIGAVVGTNTAIQVQSASSVGVNPSQTSAVAPTFWVGATGNGLSQSGNDTYLHSDDDIFFVSGGSVVAYVDNNGHIGADGAFKSTGSSDVLDTNQVATFNKINCTTTMARWSDGGGGGAPTLDQDFNISGISYNGAGTAYYELTIDVNLFNNSYAVLATSDSGAGDQQFANVLDRQTTYYQIHIKQEGGADVTGSGSSCSIGGLG